MLEAAIDDVSEAGQDRLESLFDEVPEIETVHRLKEKLRQLWDQPDEIVAGCEYDLNTSVVEEFNNRTKTLQNVTFGFRDHQYYFLKIMAVQSGGPRGQPH